MPIVLSTISFAVSALLVWQFSRPGSVLYVLDYPNERSLHSQPTPRTGGVAVIAAIVVTAAYGVIQFGSRNGTVLWVAAAGALLAVVSFIDDRYHVPVAIRLLVHGLVAAMVLFGGLTIDVIRVGDREWLLPLIASVPLTFVFIVWMVNLYNFMDGMDGFAGGMAVIGFGALAIFGWSAGNELFVVLNSVIAAAAAGFLVFNFPPAKIFLGDTGSSVLGLFAASNLIWGAADKIFPLWAGLLIFSPFIVDATVTLVRRFIRGEKVWHAHKTHYYQRLVRLGWGHRKAVLWEYALMLLCALTAIWGVGVQAHWQWAIVIGWAGAYLTLGLFVGWLERK